MSPDDQWSSHRRYDVLSCLLRRMEAEEDVSTLLRDADASGVGGRFRAAISPDPTPLDVDLDAADRRHAAHATIGGVDGSPHERSTTRLTPLEVEVLGRLAGGWPPRVIAESLNIRKNRVHSVTLRSRRRAGFPGDNEQWVQQLMNDGVIRPVPHSERDAS